MECNTKDRKEKLKKKTEKKKRKRLQRRHGAKIPGRFLAPWSKHSSGSNDILLLDSWTSTHNIPTMLGLYFNNIRSDVY